MAKVLNCRDVGFDCEGVIHADTEAEVMQQAAEHVRDVHGQLIRIALYADRGIQAIDTRGHIDRP